MTSLKKALFKDFELKKTSRLIFELENLSVGYPGKILKTFKLNVERGQRLAILGANGLGKTTLLKTLAGQLDSLSGSFKLCTKAEIAYFTQDQRDSLNPNHSVLEEILNKTSLGEKEARSVLAAFLFKADDLSKLAKVLWRRKNKTFF